MRRRSLAATLVFFLEGECTLAQAQPAPNAAASQAASGSLPLEENLHPTPWHVISSYGQASAPTSQGFAEFGSLSVARDFPLSSGFAWGVELTPLFLVNLTRVDLPDRPRESRAAVAAAPFLAWEAFPRSAVGLRLEASVGLLWAFSPVPAEGSRFNFLDILGGRVRVRLGARRRAFARRPPDAHLEPRHRRARQPGPELLRGGARTRSHPLTYPSRVDHPGRNHGRAVRGRVAPRLGGHG